MGIVDIGKYGSGDRAELSRSTSTRVSTSRRLFIGGAVAAPFVLRSGRAFAEEPLSVRVDFAPWGVHAPLHLGRKKGWFKEAGLEVDLQDGTGTLNTINLVAAGQLRCRTCSIGAGDRERQSACRSNRLLVFSARSTSPSWSMPRKVQRKPRISPA